MFIYYSGTMLNGHLSTADAHNITDRSESPNSFFIDIRNPWIADILLLYITNGFHGPNNYCTQTTHYNLVSCPDPSWFFRKGSGYKTSYNPDFLVHTFCSSVAKIIKATVLMIACSKVLSKNLRLLCSKDRVIVQYSRLKIVKYVSYSTIGYIPPPSI